MTDPYTQQPTPPWQQPQTTWQQPQQQTYTAAYGDAPAPPAPPTRRSPWPWVAAGGAVLLAVIGVLTFLLVNHNSGKSPASTITVRGNLTLIGLIGDPTASGPCDASLRGGMGDIAPGAQVVVYDATGKTVGIGELQEGTIDGGACVMPFTVAGVPAGVGPYSVEVTHRGKIAFTEAEASDVELSLSAVG